LLAARVSPAPSCDGLNSGSPKPVIGLVFWSLREKARSDFKLATDGNTDTAWRLSNQAASR
jgi:hypothetical protein